MKAVESERFKASWSKTRVKATMLLALAVLLLAGIVSYWAISSAATWFAGVNPNVAAALVAGLAAISGVLLNQRATKRKDVAEAHRSAKVDVYRRFMNFVTTILADSKGGQSVALEDRLGPNFQREFLEFTSELLVWGSLEVLRKFAAWRLAAQSTRIPESLFAVDDLLQAIRVDLRNSNHGLKRGDLIRLYLRDPGELDRPSGSTSGLGMTVEDEASLFLDTYGAPEGDLSSENETPRPPLIVRSLVYKPENVRVLFIPDAPVGTAPPFRRWKLLGFQDNDTDAPLDVARVGELLAPRKRR
jgi:hypothetical protein